MAKKFEHTLEAQPHRAFEALRRAIADLGYDLRRADGRSMSIQFNAKRGMMSVRVAMSALVLDQGDGKALISVTGKPAGKELTAWGEEGIVAGLVFDKVQEILPSLQEASPPNPPTPTTGGRAFVSELERLAALRANGALDDSEFRLAKARLLRPEASASRGGPPAPQPAPPGGAGAGTVVAAAAAGALGGMLLSNTEAANAAPSAGEPITEHVDYTDTFFGPSGETVRIEGELDSTVTFDESGDAHVEIHDEGSMTVGGETYEYDTDMEGDVDFGEGDFDAGDGEDGGFLDGLFG